MRPHADDHNMNIEVGHAVRDTIDDMKTQQYTAPAIWYEIGRQINISLQTAYDRGVQAVQPSAN